MEKDLRQATLDLIIDTINAYEERTKVYKELKNKEILLLEGISIILNSHYLGVPCCDFDRYAFNKYLERTNALLDNEMKRRGLIKP